MKKIFSILLVISILSSIVFTFSAFAEGETVTLDDITYTSYDTYCAVTGCDQRKSGEVVIPSSVNFGNEDLPVTEIGTRAFYFCSSLTNITIPDSIKKINVYAFFACSGLTNMVIPDSVTEIENNAFFRCEGLLNVTIPNSVTSIAGYTFSYCKSLTSIVIPDSVTSIGNDAFSDCVSLTNVTIGNSIESIGVNAFNNCGNLQYTEYDNALYLGNNENPYCAIIKAKDASITSVSINEKTKIVSDYAFSNCSGLTELTIPDGITSIGSNAFSGCYKLKNVTIPDSIISVGSRTFSGCSGITSVTISDSITSIDAGAFSGCSGLETVYYNGTGKQWDKITVLSDNAWLLSAEIVFSSDPGEPGTQTNPYLIYTLKDLEDFRDRVNAADTVERKYGKLMNDITMNEPDMFARDNSGVITGVAEGKTPYEWTGIGSSEKAFSGVFDGNGYKIIGIYGNGLFGECINAAVKNVGVVDGFVNVGGVIGYNRAQSDTAIVYNCYNTCTVNGTGGVIGSNTTNDGTITVNNCHNDGKIINCGSETVGGVVGYNSASISLYTGTHETESGDLEFSYLSASMYINNCYNTGDISGNGSVGGVTGSFSFVVDYRREKSWAYGHVQNCYNTGILNGGGGGGIVGSVNSECGGVDISDCYNKGNINCQGAAGGVTGSASLDRASVSIRKCYNKGDVGGNTVGGIIGGFSSYHGGVSVSSCYNTGKISGNTAVGGIVGKNGVGGSEGSAYIGGCFNSGDVSGVSSVGGIIGGNDPQYGRSTVSCCYNSGSVDGSENVGGIAGSNYPGRGNLNVYTCYNVGPVNSNGGNAGGFAGRNKIENYEGWIYISNCYYLSNTANVAYNNEVSSEEEERIGIQNVTDLTDEQMRDAAGIEGFDFEQTWTMDGNPDYPYPELNGLEHVGREHEDGGIDGDMNEDGEVDNKDVVVLFRYVSGGVKTDDESAYDFNGDGEVNNKDVVELFRFVSA